MKWDLFRFKIWICSDVKLAFFLNRIVWFKPRFMVFTWAHAVDLETWYREGINV